MAVTDARSDARRTSPVPAAGAGDTRGFRPSSRRRARIAGGAVLAAIAIGGNVLLYSSLDRSTEVLQAVRDVPAGTEITEADLRVVELGTDPSVRSVDGEDIGQVVGQFAKVRIVSGSLVVREALQPSPLLSDGAAVVALRLPESGIPHGLRERSRIQVVVPALGDGESPQVIEARVVDRPEASDSITGQIALSVEVEAARAPMLAAADDARVVLLEPVPDPAISPVAGE